MKILASHFVSSVDEDAADIQHIRGLPIQLAFYKRSVFRGTDHARLRNLLMDNQNPILSIHAPAADVFHTNGDEFISMLETIKSEYNTGLITVHPQRGERRQAKALYKKIAGRISDLGVTVAYETFEEQHGENKWISQVEDMHRYFEALGHPFLGVTYDFTHSDPQKALLEVRHFHRKIKIIHLSDARSDLPLDPNEKHQHLPLGMGNYNLHGFLELLEEIGYDGQIVLEYLPQYKSYLAGDVRLTAQFIAGDKEPLLLEIDRRRNM